MKKVYTLLTLIFVLFFLVETVHAQIFVKADASGANDGTSWTDAYSDLSDALANSLEGDQIWVAAGTYKPGGANPDSTSFFTFPHDLELYGGFAGTETMLSERDWTTNETILSGDHNDDDVDNDFVNNKLDNSLHVMWLTDTVTTASTVDGFTMRNGETTNADGGGNDRRGGAILTYGSPAIRNCYFTQNFGHFGGAVYPRGSADGVIIENCTFENNQAGFGGGIYNLGNFAVISNCTFTGNQNYGNGGGVYNGSENVSITDCTFENNSGRFGGGIMNFADTSIVSNCTFTNNQAVVSGGGMYNESIIEVYDCDFTNNLAEFGGGIANFRDTMDIHNNTFTSNMVTGRGGGIFTRGGGDVYDCSFTGNSAAASTGGAIQIRSGSSPDVALIEVNITNCDFTGNDARWGGAFGNYDRMSIAILDSCEFIDNSAGVSGGATTNAFGATTFFRNTIFRLNEAEGGGAIFSQNDSATISIINCTLSENAVSDRGGAMNIGSDGSDNFATTIPRPIVTIENTLFSNNIASQQGGAINFSNGDLTVTNSIFEYNFVVEDEGVGGAISLNTIDSLNESPEFTFINNTLVNNSGAIGAGIANWLQEDNVVLSNLILQNNIFYNPDGFNYVIEDGDPLAISFGGNLSTDASLFDVFVVDVLGDLNETFPLFVNYDEDDYHLQNESPCVDAGIPTNAPLFDFDGLPRVDNVDMGAFENQKLVGVKDLENTFGLLKIFPNPIEDNLNFSFESTINDELQVRITDMDGKVVFANNIEKTEKEISRNYNVANLVKGMYNLTITNGKYTNTVSFVKIK